jgi:hypothetical protein
MKTHLPTLAVLGGALVIAAAIPSSSSGQSGDDPAVVEALKDVTAQQATIVDNQNKIDEKIATIAEQVRQARIFAARGK